MKRFVGLCPKVNPLTVRAIDGVGHGRGRNEQKVRRSASQME